MKSSKTLIATAVVALGAFCGGAAHAVDVTYLLDVTNVGAFGTGPFGSVNLTQDGANVDFSVNLNDSFQFVMTGTLGSHALFALNGTGVSASEIVNISNGTSSTFAAYAPAGASPFGDFMLGIQCTSCANGGNGKTPSPLTFTVNNATLGDFAVLSTHGSPNAYFSADIITGTDTGQVGATGLVPGVPEPETYALMLAGLGVVGFVARRRRS